MRLKNRIIRGSMQSLLGALAWLSRREYLNGVTQSLTLGLAKIVVPLKGIRPANNLESLGYQWQRSFPSAKQVPIVGLDDKTVYAEIHTPCPLRASGDVTACYRMMNYDRAILDQIGGQFVVLSSQATPGNFYCRVAMRAKGESIDDLQPAHLISSVSIF